MFKGQSTRARVFRAAILALNLYATATVASTVTLLLMTMDLETIGFGLALPVFAAPAIFAYCALALFSSKPAVKHLVFWILFLPLPISALWVAFFPSPGALSDGADQMAWHTAIPLLIAGAVTYAVALKTPVAKCDR